MKKYLLKIEKLSYLILIREIVCQLKDQNRMIYSGSINPSVSRLDFSKFPKTIQNEYTLSELNTNSKVNINYITNKDPIDDNKQQINQTLFDILSQTKYVTDENGVEYLEFIDEKQLSLFLIFKKFKSVNAGFFDVGTRTIKKALKSYENTSGYVKIPFNKDFNNDLGPRSLILMTPEEDIIYSNRVFINFDDFFEYNENIPKLKDISQVKKSILDKLKKNETYIYAEKKNDLIFNNLQEDIDKEILKNYNTFGRMIK